MGMMVSMPFPAGSSVTLMFRSFMSHFCMWFVTLVFHLTMLSVFHLCLLHLFMLLRASKSHFFMLSVTQRFLFGTHCLILRMSLMYRISRRFIPTFSRRFIGIP